MTAGWMIGVLVEQPGGSGPARSFYAVANPDRARAEWAATDRAGGVGDLASSPFRGMEPVEAIAPLSDAVVRAMGLAEGETRALGGRWPRRWIGSEQARYAEGAS